VFDEKIIIETREVQELGVHDSMKVLLGNLAVYELASSDFQNHPNPITL